MRFKQHININNTLMKDKVVLLAGNVVGLYAAFLTWSLLQEKINTKPYDIINGSGVFFKAPLTVNAAQAAFAALGGLIYSIMAYKANPFSILGSPPEEESTPGSRYWRGFLLIAATSSLSAPLGYQALKHVDYVAFLLAKSSKLLPVMLVHFVLYRTRFPPHKYLVAAMVTGGVFLFTWGRKSSSSDSSSTVNDGRSVYGMAQLAVSMILDGLTNSTQDHLFRLKNRHHRLTGASVMCILNTFVFIATSVYLIVAEHTGELSYTIHFVRLYPECFGDIMAFAALGAIGQVFVFRILQQFGSLVLVTATVTRKMASMILSVVLFGHSLTLEQWIGVGCVFGGIGYESVKKLRPKQD